MEWNQQFSKKEDWQRKTFEMIKSDLIAVKDYRTINYDNAKEKHLVMIYGKSQVGKTTLILNMIGLNPACFNEVYETLRAGVPRGNSSTSTAIIYAKSINEKYGCSLTSINDLSSKDTQYFDKSGMIHYLEKIRQKVESNQVNPDSILFIYIPSNYFIQDSTINSISIMDMPGIESRNHKEDNHVRNLMTKYIHVASVCIIACRSNDIQSLETTILPNQVDWKRMGHRFIIVITHAYNDGTTKKILQKKPSERKEKFYEYVREAYTKEIRKILGEDNQIEVYPIDVGDTLERLCEEEIKSESDRNEIIEAKDKILSDIRSSIVSHKGEKLKSALKELDVIIKHYREDELQSIDAKIKGYQDKIQDKSKLISCVKEYLKQMNNNNSKKAELHLEIENLKCIKDQVYQFSSDCIFNLTLDTKRYIIENGLYKRNSNGVYLKDPEKKVLANLQEYIVDKVDLYNNNLSKLMKEADVGIVLKTSQITIEANSCILHEEDKLYPPKRGFFFKREKVYLDSIQSICDVIQAKVNNMFKGHISLYIKTIDEINKTKQSELESINLCITREKVKIENYKSEIAEYKNKIESLNQEKAEILHIKKQDEETRAMYLKYANKAYSEQRKEIIQQINGTNNTNDKLLLILFLGLLDKDYLKVTGGIYEDRN